MQFNVPVVKNCLLKNRCVYTVRSYKSFDKFRVVDVDGVDYLCERMDKVAKIEDLDDFVDYSGFSNCTQWWNKIADFGAIGGYMYHLSPL